MPCSDDDARVIRAAGEYLAAVQILRESDGDDDRIPARTVRVRALHDHLAGLMGGSKLLRMPGSLIKLDDAGELTILPGADAKKIKGAKRR